MEKDKRKERSTPRTVAPTKPADSDPHPARNAGWSVADTVSCVMRTMVRHEGAKEDS